MGHASFRVTARPVPALIRARVNQFIKLHVRKESNLEGRTPRNIEEFTRHFLRAGGKHSFGEMVNLHRWVVLTTKMKQRARMIA